MNELNDCPDHQWVVWIGFGKVSGHEVYQRCQNCGKEEKITVDPKPILRIEFDDKHD